MARPESNTVSYFPHKIGDGKKIFSIETKYGNDGYATWFKILEKLATTENHYLDLNDEVEIIYLSAKCKVSEQVLFSIINDLTRLGCFDKILWEKRYLWSQVFIDSIQDAYSRRNNKCMTYEGLCKHLLGLCSTKTELVSEILDSNTQSKVKESKVKKREVGFTPPSLDEVCQYFMEKGFTEQSAQKAFSYYDISNWKDSKGNPVKNWKQKMISVWFKDENKIQAYLNPYARGAAN
jgi:hypothetical protein